MNNAIVALSDLRRGRGEGTPLHKPYRYVPLQRVGLFSPFDLITGVGWGGVYFAHFGLESEFLGVPHPREQVTGSYTILMSLFLSRPSLIMITQYVS